MTRSETDGDIECAMLTTHEDAPLPTRIGKRRACSEVDELKAGLVALFLAYLGACGAAYALGRHIAGFLLESWFLGTPFGLFLISAGTIIAHKVLKDMGIRWFWRWTVHIATVLMYVAGCIGVYIVEMKEAKEVTYTLVETISLCWFMFMPLGFFLVNAIMVTFVKVWNMEGNALLSES